jgi:uncharacterized repeat protein (TIGR01451 family)/gliding motility-associated-like protein
LLNGNPVNPVDVTLTETVADPTGTLTLNPDGSVDVAPFTSGGTYTLTYQICEVLNPTNCDDAIVTIEVIKTSDISIVKTHIDPSNLPVGNPSQLIEVFPSVVTAGTKIYYFLMVENFGPDNSLQATIEDIIPAGISNPQYSLNFGNSWFAWGGTRYLADFLYPGVNYVMIRGDVDPDATGTLNNTATIYSAVTTDPDLSNNESTVVTNILTSADLELTKRALTSPVVIGGQIVYEIIVTNYGPSVATDVIITDNIDPTIISGVEYSVNGGGTWLSPWTGSLNVGDMNDGDSFTLLIRGTVIDMSPAPNVDPIPNTASVTSSDPDPDPTNNEETINTPLNDDADVSILKSGPATVVAGTQIQYSIIATNNSNTFDALNVHIHDVINSAIILNAEFSDDAGATWFAWTGEYAIGDMAPLASFEILIRGTVIASHTGNVVNTATVETNTPDSDLTNNTSTVITVVEVESDLNIVKIQIDPSILPLTEAQILGNPNDIVINPVEITAGDDIFYVLFYWNDGPSDATNVIIDDILPGFVIDWEASRCQANYGDWTGTGNLGTIIAGGRCVLVIRGSVVPEATGNLVNTAYIHSDDVTDPDPSNDESTFVTPVVAQADLSIVKTVDNSTPYVGDDVTFTITLTNNGPSEATNVEVVDQLPTGYTYVSHTVTTGTFDSGTGLWEVGTVTFPGNEVLTITATVNAPSGNYLNVSTITDMDQFDPDNDNNEDDENTDPINVIIANDDAAGPINGFYGALNILNVFDNDLLNGSLVVPADLMLTETVADPTGSLTLNSDGSVDLAPNTPAGTYTLTYQICEIANPTNCDDAIVTITVEAPEIIANDDIAGGVNGFDGQISVLNVFDNDLLNGNPVDPSDVTLTETVADPTGTLTLNPDGSVDVAPGTAAGTYTLTYEICEIVNPTNCDDAQVIITVVATSIIANDDSAADVDGTAGVVGILNVFDNDLLNGDPVNPADVTLTEIVEDLTGSLTLNPDGTVDVSPGTPAGTYTLTYEICEILNPTNCDDAIVTIYVIPGEIIANDDIQGGVNGYDGQTNILNVFDNDLLSGDPVNPADVTLAETVADPTGSLTLNPDGSVDLAPGTPAGTYSLTYEICEILNPTNCDDALVIITVGATSIIANDDYSYDVNGHAGETAVVNVFDNDLLNGNPVNPAEVILTETIPEDNGYLVLNPDGTVDVLPNTPAGTYYLTYQICEVLNPSNCDDAQVFVTVLHASIAATDDNFTSSPVDCEFGGVAGNVLDNDLLDGAPVDSDDVVITLTNDGGIVGASISANGNLNIPAGLAVGTYYLSYEICEVINPTNCDDADITVVIQDFVDPTITCPADVAVNSDAGTCEATNVVIGTPTVNDNCGVNTVTGVRDDMLALTDPYPLGTTTITWTVTDFSGNIATCEQIVTVTDIELPTIVCPAPVAVNTDADECTASGVDLGTPVVDDNCTVASVTNDAPAVFPIGTTTVTWTVTDGSGNIATCEQIVTVTDIELPTIVCPAPVAVNTDADECTASGVDLGMPIVDDNCEVASVTNDAPAVFPIGTTTVTWTVTDGSGNIATCEQIVTVTDIELPTIVCPAPVAVNTDADECTASGVDLGMPTVDDNCTVASVTNDAPAVFPIGTTTVTWTVTDGSGNIATCEQIVTVTDIELPTIVCPAPVAVNTDADECTASGVDLGTPVVDDNCTVASVTNDAPAVFPIGTTTVTWTVTDGSGNIATCEQIVTVTDIELPTIICPAPVAVNTDADECTASGVDLGMPTVDDNCTVASVTNDAPAVFPIGETIVTWTVTDGSGNIATCEQIVTVTDIELPTIVCPEDIVSCTNVIELVAPEVYDNCGVDNIYNNAPAVFQAGTTIVIWTVTDVNGNIATCEQLVHVSLMDVVVEASSQVSCTDASDATITVSVEGAFGDVTYSLNGGTPQSSNIFEGLPAGTYTVLVEDENACSVLSEVIIINNPAQIEADLIVSSQVSCFDSNDGSIEVAATGGTGQLSYSLNGGPAQASNSFDNLEAGTYTIVIEDENMCSISLTDIIIENPEAISVSLESTDAVSCFGANDGTIEVFVDGGTGDYTVILTNVSTGLENTLSGSFIFEDLIAGSYTIEVIDANGCTETLEATIGTPEELTLSHAAYCDEGIVGIELTASGGDGNYLYSIDGGQNWTQSGRFENLDENIDLMLMLTDGNNCLSEIITIPVESLNTLSASSELVSGNSCFGVNDAAIQINVESGITPYTFIVNGTDIYYTEFIDSLYAGDYVIQVQDANGCPAITEISIESSEEIEIELISTTNADCNGNNNGTAEIEVVGGFGEFDYNWSNGSNNRIVSDLYAGTHTVTVTDLKDCKVTYDVIIESDEIGVKLVMNNVFTPNNDGINDYFTITNLEMYPDNELVVLNRWGNEVYSKSSYDNLWDGSNLSEGTYFYVLKVKVCEEYKTFSGYVTILK